MIIIYQSNTVIHCKYIGMFDIPTTLITNDPEKARIFYRSHGGQVVMECLHHHLVQIKNKEYMIYTRRLLESDLLKLDDFLAVSPEYYKKKY